MASASTQERFELQTFLGFARSFVKGLAQIAKLLYQQVAQQSKKQPARDPQFQWTSICQAAFEALISQLTSPSVLAYPGFSLLFILNTDRTRSLDHFRPDNPELAWMFRERSRLVLQDGVLYRRRTVEGREKLQLVFAKFDEMSCATRFPQWGWSSRPR